MMTKSNLFCDNTEMLIGCSEIIGQYLFGSDLCSKIRIRYEDLKANFDAVTYDEWSADGDYSLWKFSSGLTPYMDYDDTSIVPIPIANELFKLNEAVVSFDFPIWFNMDDTQAQRIMFITQDPISREIKWYKDCRDALCTTVFSIHNPLWRNKGNGGKRIWLLANKFVENGYGIYFTDGYKFAIQSTSGEAINPDPAQVAAYREMLNAEIELVKPNLIVMFGRLAEDVLKSLSDTHISVLSLPHFSGQAQGKIKDFFNWSDDKPFTISEQAACYFNTITKEIPQ